MRLKKQNLVECLGKNLIEIKGDCIVDSYSIDSRTLQTGDIFVALSGVEDGHNYLNVAISKGASALIISQEFYSKNQINFSNLIIVKDTLQALSDIAKFNGEKFRNYGGKLIGITGSVGKTTFKEMLSFVLSQDNLVSSTVGNFNNHIGLPLCLAQINSRSKFGVYELGMSSKGEILHLSKILKPQVAIITEIAEAHSEFFASTEKKSSLDLIAEAKAEILDGMDSGSLIFLNKDNNYFDCIRNKAIEKKIDVYSFSLSNKDADIYIKSSTFKNYSMKVIASIFNTEITYEIKSIAQHNALLSALALGLAKKMGIEIKTIAEQFLNFQIPNGRGKISEILFKDKKITLIDDSYNANPKSMNSGILALKNINANKILVLGDMLELGENEVAEHIKLKDSIKQLRNIKSVIFVGNLMRHCLVDPQEFKVQHFSNYEQAIEYLESDIKVDDLLFIKGSLGSNVYKISKYLQN